MLKATVVEDHIHHDLKSLLVGLITEQLILLVRAEARVYLIIIGGSIAVIGRIAILGIGRIVLKDWGKPEGCNAQLLEIVQVFTNSVQVAAMAQTRLVAILHIVAHALDLSGVVSALSKAVGHQHIEHVGIGESHALIAAHLALLQLILHLGLAETERHSARLSIAHVHIDQQIVRRIEAHKAVDTGSWIVGCYTGNIAYTFSVNHQLHCRVFHPDIPVGGLDTVNHCLFCCTH